MRHMVIRTTFKANEPKRREATSAKSAVAVHDMATINDMISPLYMH